MVIKEVGVGVGSRNAATDPVDDDDAGQDGQHVDECQSVMARVKGWLGEYWLENNKGRRH